MTQPLTRRVLQLLLVSVAVSAAMGVYALLLGEFRETQGKLLATTVSISGASTFGLVSGIALERGRLGLVPWLGIAASAVCATLIVIGPWAVRRVPSESTQNGRIPDPTLLMLPMIPRSSMRGCPIPKTRLR